MTGIKTLILSACIMKYGGMCENVKSITDVSGYIFAQYQSLEKNALTVCSGVNLTVGHIESDTTIHIVVPLQKLLSYSGRQFLYF